MQSLTCETYSLGSFYTAMAAKDFKCKGYGSLDLMDHMWNHPRQPWMGILYRTGLVQFLPCHVDSGAVSSFGQFMLSWPICISSWRWWVVSLPPVEYVLQPLGFSIWSIISWAGFSVAFPVPCLPNDYPFFIESSDWATPLLIPGLCLSWNFILH